MSALIALGFSAMGVKLPTWLVTLIEWAVLGLAILAAFLAAWALFAHIYEGKGYAKAQAELNTSAVALTQCHANVTTLEGQLQAATDATIAAKATSDKIDKAAGVASAAAVSTASSARKAADAVLAIKPPPVAATDPSPLLGLCAAAMAVKVGK